MDADYFRMLFAYDRWATERVLAQADSLTVEQYAAAIPGLSMGSIQAALGHCLGAEVVWLSRCRGASPKSILSGGDFPTVSNLRERWALQHAEMQAYVDSLTDGDVNRAVTYRTTGGVTYTNTLAHVLAHVVNHSTQFRSEAAVGLTRFGKSPGDLDMIVYLRVRGMA